jgi:hypothetical protein
VLRIFATAFHLKSKIDEFVKSRKTPFFVIPAEAGIKSNHGVLDLGVRRGDGFGDFLRSRQNCLHLIRLIGMPPSKVFP